MESEQSPDRVDPKSLKGPEEFIYMLKVTQFKRAQFVLRTDLKPRSWETQSGPDNTLMRVQFILL